MTVCTFASASGGSDGGVGTDAAEAVERMRREQVRRALHRLEAQGEVTDEQRRTVERLSNRLVRVLRDPAAGVVETRADDAEAVRNYFQTE